jgi:hypothetical protein
MAVAISVFLAPAAALAADRNSKDEGAKPVAAASKETSTGLAIAAAAASSGAQVQQIAVPGRNADAKGNDAKVGPKSDVPPGKRCDPNDPRPGCQPLPMSGKK